MIIMIIRGEEGGRGKIGRKMNYDDLGWMGARRNTTVIKELAAYRENEMYWNLFIPRNPSRSN